MLNLAPKSYYSTKRRCACWRHALAQSGNQIARHSAVLHHRSHDSKRSRGRFVCGFTYIVSRFWRASSSCAEIYNRKTHIPTAVVGLTPFQSSLRVCSHFTYTLLVPLRQGRVRAYVHFCLILLPRRTDDSTFHLHLLLLLLPCVPFRLVLNELWSSRFYLCSEYT